MKTKKILTRLLLLLLSNSVFGQKVISGVYSNGLTLSYDSAANRLSGYYENYTGWDEETKSSKFSCVFYIEGIAVGQKFNVKTYYPTDKKDDNIDGTIEIMDSNTIAIQLREEHGGCWNVQHFAEKSEMFQLEKREKWLQIKYVDIDKAYFYKDKSVDAKMKAYLVRGDIIYIEKIENNWAFCIYAGDQTTKGWLRIAELNRN